MSTALPRYRLPEHNKRIALRWLVKWQKPWTGTLPETSLYAMLFLWVGSEHNFTVAGIIAATLAFFFCFLPR